MKILVTGAAGLIGSWIAESLLEEGHDVVGVDNFIGAYYETIDQLQKRHSDRFLFWHVDVCSFDRMNVAARDCDVVYHCAALAHEGLSVFSPTAITQSIMTGTTSVAAAAISSGVKKFINCSSMARYGKQPIPFTEWTPPVPEDPYAVAKVAAEQQLNMLGRLHGMQVIHTVPHNVIGPNQRYTDPYRNVVAIMANMMLQGRQPIIYGDGTQERCFSMIQDDIEIYKKLLDYEPKDIGEIFNIGPDDEGINMNDLASMIADILGFDLKPDYQPARPFEVHKAMCSSDKIRNVFGYEKKTSLREGIESVVEYIKERGPAPFEYHVELEIENEHTPRTWKDRLF
jgi:UDP-glucose 4-epimerase